MKANSKRPSRAAPDDINAPLASRLAGRFCVSAAVRVPGADPVAVEVADKAVEALALLDLVGDIAEDAADLRSGSVVEGGVVGLEAQIEHTHAAISCSTTAPTMMTVSPSMIDALACASMVG